MSKEHFASHEFAKYAALIRHYESSGNYGEIVKNKEAKQYYFGAYQLSPPALQAAGFQDKAGNWTALARSFGVSSYNDLVAGNNAVAAQDKAFQNFTESNYDQLRKCDSYIGKRIDGVEITLSGMLGSAHLNGESAEKKFLDSNGKFEPVDGNGVPLKNRMKDTGGFNFSFAGTLSTFGGAKDIPLHSSALAIGRALTSLSVAPNGRTGWNGPVRQRSLQGVARPEVEAPRLRRPAQAPHASAGRGLPTPESRRERVNGRQAASVPAWMGAWRNGAAAEAVLIARDPGMAGLKAEFAQRQFSVGVSRVYRAAPVLAAVAAAGTIKVREAVRLAKHSTRMAAVRVAGRRVGMELGVAGGPRAAALHSVAPMPKGRPAGGAGQERHAESQDTQVAKDAARRRRSPDRRATAEVDDRGLSRALSDLLDQQARLPPSGATGFDPRLSPAWPGLKLPA